MKFNANKCKFLVSTKVCQINYVAINNKFKIKIKEINIEGSTQEELLEVILYDQLSS